jgi:hypothetical protein
MKRFTGQCNSMYETFQWSLHGNEYIRFRICLEPLDLVNILWATYGPSTIGCIMAAPCMRSQPRQHVPLQEQKRCRNAVKQVAYTNRTRAGRGFKKRMQRVRWRARYNRTGTEARRLRSFDTQSMPTAGLLLHRASTNPIQQELEALAVQTCTMPRRCST